MRLLSGTRPASLKHAVHGKTLTRCPSNTGKCTVQLLAWVFRVRPKHETVVYVDNKIAASVSINDFVQSIGLSLAIANGNICLLSSVPAQFYSAFLLFQA